MSSVSPESPRGIAGTGRRIFRNATALAIGGLLAQGCMVAVEALIARRLGQGAYGVFSTAYAFGLIGMFAVDMGMSWKLIQDGSRDARSMPMLLGTTLALRALLALAVYPLMVLGFGMLGLGAAANGFFAILFLYVLLMCVQNALAAVNAAEQRMHVTAAFQGVTPAAILALALLATALNPSLVAVGIAFVIGSLGVTGAWAWTTFRRLKPYARVRESGRQILRDSYLYAVTGILLHGSLRLELLLLSVFRPMAEVGLFAAADKFADLGMKVAVAGSRVLAPVLFQQSHLDPAVFRLSCRRTLRASTMLGVGVALGLALAADWIVPLVFGREFVAAGAILVLLAASLGLRFMNQALQIILTASDRHARRTIGQATGVAAAICGNLTLIPMLGTLGAACARLIGDVVQLSVLLTSASLPVPRLRATAWLLAPLAMGIVCYWLFRQFELPGLLRLAGGLASYGALLLGTGTVRIGELRELVKF